jgi:hypothetical protein
MKHTIFLSIAFLAGFVLHNCLHAMKQSTAEKLMPLIVDPEIPITKRAKITTTLNEASFTQKGMLIYYLKNISKQDIQYPNEVIKTLLSGEEDTSFAQKFNPYYHEYEDNIFEHCISKNPTLAHQSIANDYNKILPQICLWTKIKQNIIPQIFCVCAVFKTINKTGSTTIKNLRVPKPLISLFIDNVINQDEDIKDIINALEQKVICENEQLYTPFEYLTKTKEPTLITFLDPQQWKDNPINVIKSIALDLEKK